MLNERTEGQILGQLNALIQVPGYIEAVAKELIALVKRQNDPSKVIECKYGGVVLHVYHDSTVESILMSFRYQCMKRSRRPHLRLVSG